MATLADQIIDIQNKVTALQAAVAAIPTTASTGTATDLTPVLTAVSGVQTTANAIEAKLTPTA